MRNSQTAVTREVRRFMDANHLTQADVAARLGITQAKVSARLRGVTRWSLNDLDKLWDMGVDIALPALAGWGGDEA